METCQKSKGKSNNGSVRNNTVASWDRARLDSATLSVAPQLEVTRHVSISKPATTAGLRGKPSASELEDLQCTDSWGGSASPMASISS